MGSWRHQPVRRAPPAPHVRLTKAQRRAPDRALARTRVTRALARGSATSAGGLAQKAWRQRGPKPATSAGGLAQRGPGRMRTRQRAWVLPSWWARPENGCLQRSLRREGRRVSRGREDPPATTLRHVCGEARPFAGSQREPRAVRWRALRPAGSRARHRRFRSAPFLRRSHSHNSRLRVRLVTGARLPHAMAAPSICSGRTCCG